MGRSGVKTGLEYSLIVSTEPKKKSVYVEHVELVFTK